MIKFGNLPQALTDDELQHIYENWTDESWKILAERSIRIAIKVAGSFQNTGIENEELVCIAMLGLVKAAQKFNPDYGNKFSSFAIPVIRNEILMMLRRERRNVRPSISVNDIIESENDCCEYGELLPDSFSVEEYILGMESVGIIRDMIKKETLRNQKVIACYINGMKQNEIAIVCSTSQPNVSRIIKRFKNAIMEVKEK